MKEPAAVGRAREALATAEVADEHTLGTRGVSAVWVAAYLGLGDNAARVALNHLVDSGEAHRERSFLHGRTWVYRLVTR